MISYLQLYIKGQLISEKELCMPEYNRELSFENNCNLRYAYLEYQIESFRIQHLRRILKFNNEYEIYFRAESKLNEEEDILFDGLTE